MWRYCCASLGQSEDIIPRLRQTRQVKVLVEKLHRVNQRGVNTFRPIWTFSRRNRVAWIQWDSGRFQLCKGVNRSTYSPRRPPPPPPSSLKVHDSRSGIRKDDHQMLNMIAKCSRHTDTALKLISRSKEGSPLDIKQLLIRLIAQIKYLQNACLTGKMRVWSAQCTITPAIAEKQFWFHNQSISNVRIAAELASIPQSNSQSPNPSRFRGGFNRRYRGNYRSFGSFRGNNRDIFHSLKGQLRFLDFSYKRASDDD